MNSLQDIFHVKYCEIYQLTSQRILNQKKFHCSVVKNSQGKL